MKKGTLIKSGCALALALSPYSVFAATERAGLEACVEAVVAELAGQDGSMPSIVMENVDVRWGGRLGHRETFHLDLKHAKSMEVVARADCVVDSRATVRRVTNLPLEADEAAQRASS